MDIAPSDHDEALLARLNALKKSSVTLQQNDPFVASTASPAATTDLSERFKKLSVGRASNNARNNAPNISDGITHDDSSAPSSPTLDELVADLATDEDRYTLDPHELTEAEGLIAEARVALAQKEESTETASESASKNKPASISESHSVREGFKERDAEEPDEETEAACSLQRMLDELTVENDQDEISVKNQSQSRSLNLTSDLEEDNSVLTTHQDDPSSPLKFPSAPMGLATSSSSSDLALPAAPTAAPKAQPKKRPIYTNDEIDSWCIICLAMPRSAV